MLTVTVETYRRIRNTCSNFPDQRKIRLFQRAKIQVERESWAFTRWTVNEMVRDFRNQSSQDLMYACSDLMHAIHDHQKYPSLRRLTTWSFGELKDARAVLLLIGKTESKDHIVRTNAIRSLAKIGQTSEEVAHSLEKRLDFESEKRKSIRITALEATINLGILDHPSIVRVLYRARVDDPDQLFKDYVIHAQEGMYKKGETELFPD